MKNFNENTYQIILKNVNFNNDYNFETFSESLIDQYDYLTEADVEEVIEFLDNELGISSDSDLHGLSRSGINNLSEFINDLLD